MKLLKFSFFFLFYPLIFHAQRTADSRGPAPVTKQPVSRILPLSDSSFLKIELRDALYDASLNNLPYFPVSHPAALNQKAIPTLIMPVSVPVTGKAAQFIKKEFQSLLSNEYRFIPVEAISAGQNLNHYRLVPFRITGAGEIEELVSYKLGWEIQQAEKQATASAATFTTSSVLASGNWYKIAVTRSGIHRLDRNFFLGLGINLSSLDPRNIRIYGNGGKAVPDLNKAFRYDDLQENAIEVVGESDGVFDPQDHVLFYASDVNAWERNKGSGLKFRRIRNYYSDTSFYFLNVDLGAGKRIQTLSQSSSPNVSTASYDYYNFHEKELVNFIKSGKQFFGEYFDFTNTYNFSFLDGSFVTGDTLKAEIQLAARGKVATYFQVSGNGISGNVVAAAVDVTSSYDNYADAQSVLFTSLNTNASSIAFSITKNTPGTVGWLDYILVNARRQLTVSQQYQFRDSRVAAPGNVCEYQIMNNSNAALQIWNISDPLNPRKQAFSSNGNSITFAATADSVMEYAVCPATDFYTPVYVGQVPNQNLHASAPADYILIAHPLFVSQAHRLGQLHQQEEGLSYLVATTDKIYNEFGSGKPEAAAIRDFIRMLYVRYQPQGKQPKYIALLGDGSYNNKSRSLISNTNLIPTYQSFGSLSVLASTTSDDFYGLMDPDEGANAENVGAVDLGVGRLVAKNTDEMNGIVNKIYSYYRKDPSFDPAAQNNENCTVNSTSPMGDWRTWVMFMADDGDGAIHMSQANSLANQLKNIRPLFNAEKIYLDAYQRFSTPGGHRYPDAQADMNKRVNKGVLLFNFTGHGGEVGLTSERVLDIETINNWNNINQMHLFVTATCEFTRYDDPGRTSAGELCLLNPRGGSVALMTTCRLAFSSTNFVLNTILIDRAFEKRPDGKYPTLGDIIRGTKAQITQNIYYANFHLIGDPALTLAYPEHTVSTTMINTTTVTAASSDTIGALDKITIKGFLADSLGNKLSSFNGVIYPTVFDKEQDITALLNDPSSYDSSPGNPFKFKLQKNILYRGKASVKNGEFSFTFLVPKDISFAYGPGKITYYATDGKTDAAGVYTRVVVGGSGNANPEPDAEGPQVTMYLNEKNFVNGGTTNERPVFYAQINDASGINTIGTGIGHDISIVLDRNSARPVILNDYFEADLDSYQSGRVRYPFENLSEGTHNLSFKVWDIQNNSSLAGMDFVVAKSAELALNHVLNYPNPFSNRTTFFFEHNQACNPLKVTVQVFTISGKVVKTIQQTITCDGFRPEGIVWDGKDDFGDKLARGVYIYKVAILNSESKKAEKTEKLVILN